MKYLVDIHTEDSILTTGPDVSKYDDIMSIAAKIAGRCDITRVTKIGNEKYLYRCSLCNKYEYLLKYDNGCWKELQEYNICYTCNFWLEKVIWRLNNCLNSDNKQCIVIYGKHYIIEPIKPWSVGREYVIELRSGVVYTKHLWHQGKIPERFRCILTDNANIL